MIPSPCIGVCAYDAATGWCLGCGRAEAEVAVWSRASEAERAAVWAALPERRRRLGIPLRRPAWDAEAIRAFAIARLREGGVWTVGVRGGLAVLPIRDPDARIEDETLTARAPDGALRLRLGRSARAIEALDAEGCAKATMLALHRSKLPEAPPAGLTVVGPDADPIDAAGRGGLLFDLGLGSSLARFMVRVAEGPLAARLRTLEGAPLARVLAETGAALVAESPTRVVESPIARAEIDAPIPGPGGVSPAGCRTHLAPQSLAPGRGAPPGVDAAEDFPPLAVFRRVQA